MVIRYAIAPCILGQLLVAASERGLVAVAFGDDESELITELATHYPHATLTRDDAGLVGEAAAILSALEGQLSPELPFDVPATAFQRRVWDALRQIPAGTTVSYGQLARSLGQPTATRAVARACATNRLALLIPCHRVVREDGGLGGYRWGLDRKRALLEGERGR
ncbi:MAG: methylated-DNA--[protein]-cysteine S-methyltransferase [Candidatus Sericytochromatia bacterium]